MHRLALLLLLLAPSGCGFIFTHGPPQGYEQLDYFTCTESNTGPILDVIWAGLNVLGAVIVISDPDEYEDSDQIIATGLAWGAISGTAGGVGFSKTSKCREAKQGLAARQSGSNVESQGAYLNMPRWAYTSWYSTGIDLPMIQSDANRTP